MVAVKLSVCTATQGAKRNLCAQAKLKRNNHGNYYYYYYYYYYFYYKKIIICNFETQMEKNFQPSA